MINDVNAYLRELKGFYREQAVNSLNFWLRHGIDWEMKGIVTSVDREGKWFDDKKNGWFTGRSMFSFARGYNSIDPCERWLDAAVCIYDFLTAHQFAPDGRLYLSMSRSGEPIGDALQDTLHSESFAIMGLSELYRATGRQDVRETLMKVFDMQQFIYHNPDYVTTGQKNTSGGQPKVTLPWLMTLMCSAQTMREALPERAAQCSEEISGYIGEIYKHHFNKELDTIMEHAIDDPGHNMEVAWFILAEGLYIQNREYVERGAKYINDVYDYGWDHEAGGLFGRKNMFDRSELPADLKKSWWPCNEVENGLLYAYIGTGDIAYLEKFQNVHEWVFAHFLDPEYGEWYGSLNRDGTPVNTHKGSFYKGPFHTCRSFFAIYEILDAYLKKAG